MSWKEISGIGDSGKGLESKRGAAVMAMHPPSRHPLVALAFSFAVGCFVGMRNPWHPGVAAAMAGVFFCAWVAAWAASRRNLRWQAVSSVLLNMSVCAVACWAAMLSAQADYNGVEMMRELVDAREDAVLRGRVASAPAVVKLPHGGARASFFFTVVEVPDEYGGVSVPGSPRVLVEWYGPETMVEVDNPPFRMPREGEGWQFNGRLREISTRSAVPLVKLSIRGWQHASRRHQSMDAPAPLAALWRLRGYAGRTLSIGVEGDDKRTGVSIVKAMTLGFRSDLPSEVEDFFRLSGTVHVFSISGLHVCIIAGMVMGVLCLVPMSQKLRVLVFSTVLVLYTVAVGAGSSAVRACVMSLFLFGAPLLGRKSDPMSSLAGAAIAILAWSPREIVGVGFIMSFACTAGILAFMPVLLSLGGMVAGMVRTARAGVDESAQPALVDLVGPDGMPKDRVPPKKFSVMRFAAKYIYASACVSLAAWVASAPVTAIVFGQMTPVALACNLVIVPLANAIVALGALSMVLGMAFPWAAHAINNVGVAFADAMVLIARNSAAMPGGNFKLEPWGMAEAAIWYAAMVLLYFALRALMASGMTTAAVRDDAAFARIADE